MFINTTVRTSNLGSHSFFFFGRRGGDMFGGKCMHIVFGLIWHNRFFSISEPVI
jgi:hypothetical protein